MSGLGASALRVSVRYDNHGDEDEAYPRNDSVEVDYVSAEKAGDDHGHGGYHPVR